MNPYLDYQSIRIELKKIQSSIDKFNLILEHELKHRNIFKQGSESIQAEISELKKMRSSGYSLKEQMKELKIEFRMKNSFYAKRNRDKLSHSYKTSWINSLNLHIQDIIKKLQELLHYVGFLIKSLDNRDDDAKFVTALVEYSGVKHDQYKETGITYDHSTLIALGFIIYHMIKRLIEKH